MGEELFFLAEVIGLGSSASSGNRQNLLARRARHLQNVPGCLEKKQTIFAKAMAVQ